jgi:inosine/xanthosine triphosphatase
MDHVIVAVGSKRKPKLNAVTEALEKILPLLAGYSTFRVIGREVPSGVGHTPASREELMRGARQRANALLQLDELRQESPHFYVGLEGGLEVVQEEDINRVFLESWAYVSDGARGYFGRSGGVEIPETLAAEVLTHGVELGEAIDRFAGEKGIRDSQGAWGVLTVDQITRQSAFCVAIIAAFAPFYNARMYRSVSGASG